MKEINVSRVIPVVKKLCIDSNYYASPDVVEKIEYFLEKEESTNARDILNLILDNFKT